MSARMKWGLGLGGVGLLIGLGLALVPGLNFCAPVLALIGGAVAAYLAGQEDPDNGQGAANGAKTGAIAGAVMTPMFIGALLIGLGVAGAGLAIGGSELTESDIFGIASAAGYAIAVFCGGAFLNLLLGAVGGLIGGALVPQR